MTAKQTASWKKRNPDKVAAQRRRYKKRHPLRLRERRQVDRAAVFGHYGKVCVGCGENDLRVLTIDHIDQKGARHRKKLAGGTSRSFSGYRFYRWLRMRKFPPGYRVLCFNCNMRAWVSRFQ